MQKQYYRAERNVPFYGKEQSSIVTICIVKGIIL